MTAEPHETIILGIDPGSRITGYGVIRSQQNRPVYLGSGCIRTGSVSLPEKLKKIYDGVGQLIGMFHPTIVSIERVFMAKNADSALKLGHARGSAIVAAASHELAVYEYAPRQIKQAVVGYGSAEKQQVQHMVCRLLRLSAPPPTDAADALACALCHFYTDSSALIQLRQT